MSAAHVLGVVPEGDAQLHVAHLYLVKRGEIIPTFRIQPVYVDQKHDIAIGKVKEWPYDEHYSIDSTGRIVMNVDVLTYEYSASHAFRDDSSGRTELKFIPTFHKGHITRKYVDDSGFQRPVECIDLSYPAFKRASGAPVIVNDGSFSVVGLIIANVERQLLPAHLERIESPGGIVEERRYFLPMAQAIQAVRLRATLKAAKESWAQ